VTYVPVVPPELIVAPNRLADDLGTTRPEQHNLFVYPVQSNFSGVQHPWSGSIKPTNGDGMSY
jgi:selenocysteine lyase/cysteine desulfurase